MTQSLWIAMSVTLIFGVFHLLTAYDLRDDDPKESFLHYIEGGSLIVVTLTIALHLGEIGG